MKVDLYWIEGLATRLAIMAKPRGGDWLDGEIAFLRAQSIDTLVSLLTDAETEELGLVGEAEACQRLGIELLRFPFEDRSVPTDEAEFLALLDKLTHYYQRGCSIAVHCRMGIGRSSLLVACLLGRLGIAVADAFHRISVARGCEVPDTPQQHQWAVRFVEGNTKIPGSSD